MLTNKKHLRLLLAFILMNMFFFTSCMPAQSGGLSIETPNQSIVVVTMDNKTSIIDPINTQTESQSIQESPPVSSSTITIPAASITPPKLITATEPASTLEPFPISWIAFEDSVPGTIDIIQTNGMGRRQIVESVVDPRRPVWSPDGDWIAFLGSSDVFERQIYIVRPDGRELKQLTFTPGHKNSLSWSPDGQSIVYSQVTHKGNELEQSEVDLFIYEIKSSQIRQLTTTQSINELFPAYSPLGDAIAFTSIGKGEQQLIFELMVMDLDQNDLRQIIDSPINIKSFTWSPDGSHIIFISSGTEDGVYACNDIYMVNANGGDLHQLTTSHESYDSLSWYPSGKWVTFTKAACNDPAAPGFTAIYVMQSSGDESILVPGTLKGNSPTWSPWPAIHIDETYSITKLGTNLKLYSSPSLSANVLGTLNEGESISVFEGPIEVDNYLWWNVSVKNGEIEGWVAENPGWFSLNE